MTATTTPTEATFRHRDAAEEICAHLASLRGGGLFLSPIDGRLLLQWLEKGVAVSTILFHLEDAHAQRRARKVRSPLKLATIKRRIAKLADEPTPATPSTTGLGPLIHALNQSPHPAEQQAATQLEALGLPENHDELRRAALAVCRETIDRIWEDTDRGALRTEADALLDALRETLSERRYDAILEETARDLLRQRHPLLSATAIWDTLG